MAKRNKQDPLVGKSFRLPKSQIEFVELLVAHQVFPGNESDGVIYMTTASADTPEQPEKGLDAETAPISSGASSSASSSQPLLDQATCRASASERDPQVVAQQGVSFVPSSISTSGTEAQSFDDCGFSLWESLKLGDYVLNKFSELDQRWNNRLVMKGKSVGEQYLEGKISFIAHIRRVGAEANPLYETCAVINRHPVIGEDEIVCGDGGELPHCHHVNHRNVLVGDVETMEAMERVVPSRVSLERAHFIDDLWSGPVYFSFSNSSFKVVRIIPKGEINRLGIPIGEWADKIASKEIKRGAQVVNGIAQDQDDVSWQRLLDPNDKIAQTRVLMGLNSGDIRIQFAELGDSGIEVVDVLFGPFNL